MPYRKKPEENAPSRKYFSAASWLSSRRRRASPHSRYSGSDSTSSATNIVSRSLDAGNSIMPPTANSISGKTSVCSTPRVEASRSASVPGSAAAWPANAVQAALEPALGEQQHADQREHQQRAPDEERRAVDGDRALGGDRAVGGRRRRATRGRGATMTVATRAATSTERPRARLQQVARAARGERLDEHARRSPPRRSRAAARAGRTRCSEPGTQQRARRPMTSVALLFLTRAGGDRDVRARGRRRLPAAGCPRRRG